MKKYRFVFALVLLCTLLLAACGGGQDKGASSGTEQTSKTLEQSAKEEATSGASAQTSEPGSEGVEDPARIEGVKSIEMTVEDGSVTFSALPETADEFASLLSANGLADPQNTGSLFLLALQLYTQDKDAGLKAVNMLRGPQPLTEYDTQFLNDRLREKAYLPLAYFDGALPDNNYTPATPYIVRFYADPNPQDVEEGYVRLYLQTAGADSARPIKLRQKDGQWFMWEYSSILSGIRLPASEDAWA